MRCRACDAGLSDFESSVKSARTGDYLDMCNRCLAPIRRVLETSENFLLYDPAIDDLDTQFERIDEMAIPGGLEDDAASAVDGDGERRADKGERRYED